MISTCLASGLRACARLAAIALLGLIGCRAADAPPPPPLVPEINLFAPPPPPPLDAGKRRFRFAHIGNPLVDFAGKTTYVLSADSDRLLVDALTQVHSSNPVEHVMIGGNLIHNTGVGDNDLLLAVARLRMCRVPVHVVFGPRDLRAPEAESVSRAEVIEAFAQHEIPASSPYYRVTPTTGVHFVVLDTTAGSVDGAQLAWLARDLGSLPAEDVTIVFTHHLLVEPWDEALAPRVAEHVVRNAAQVVEVLEAAPTVKAVSSSSLGLASITTRNGIHYVSCPALGHYPCAFRTYTLHERALEVATLVSSERKLETLGVLAIREDRAETYRHYGFDEPDDLVEFLRGGNEAWAATLPLR